MKKIGITRSVHEKALAGSYAQVSDVAYVSRERDVLLQSITVGGKGLVRRSEDNGRTWREVDQWDGGHPIDDVREYQRGLPMCWLDPDTGYLARTWYENEMRTDVVAWHPDNIGYQTRRMFYQVSDDEGQTWSEARQLIVKGGDAEKWGPGIVHGINSVVISTKPMLKDDRGRIMLAYNGAIGFGDSTHNPDIPPEQSSPDGNHQFRSGYIFGTWVNDGRDIEWEMEDGVTLSREYSCDGADEPSGDFLPNGDLFVVYRARRFANTGQQYPGMHYYAISHDQAQTWDPRGPRMLVYDDGTYALSPACLPHVLRSAENGRVYVITNFTEHQPLNCDPRNELYIAEIDVETHRIIRGSMTIIERAEPKEGHWPPPRFSNFCWYEDRHTGDIVLFLSHGGAEGYPQIEPHAYRYDIVLPV